MEQDIIQEVLLEVFPFYLDLESNIQQGLHQAASLHKYEAGKILHAGKEDCAGLFLIKSGRIRAYIVTEEGKEITLFRLLEQDVCIFSASCMMKNITFDIWVSAETEVEAVQIPSRVFEQYTKKNILLSQFSSELISARMSDVMWVLEQMLFASFDKRLANFLLEQSVLEESNTLHITHEQIANHLGSAREVVSRMLKYFSKEGYVDLNRGTIEILDEKALGKLSD
ncbi:MAG: Crp/Fnr family transcriptional regulator [Lachnospiraceae bacterium]